MLKTKPKTDTHPNLKLAIRRPSPLWQQAFASAKEAQHLAHWLETHPLFRALQSEGVIRKVRWTRFLPYERYLAYMERHAIAFVHRHRLYERPEWQLLLTHPDAEEFLSDLAKRWELPERELRRVVRFLRTQPKPPQELLIADVSPEEVSAPLAIGEADFSEVVDLAIAFVRRYGISQQDFVDYLLSGRYSARQIAERFGCTVAEAQALIEALDRLELQEMLGEPTVALPSPVTPTKISDEQLLAEVWVDEMGQLRWRFIDAHLTQRYLVDRQRLEEWKRQHGENAELPQLLTALQALNERNGTIAMLLQTLCRLQRDFLRTGNPLDLRPLPQAEVARQIGCHRSIVCRLIKGQWLKTPHGRLALVELFPSRREVIARLHSAFPDWSDRQIADYLRERFGIRLSRRAVTYHRHRADSTDAPLQSASHSKGH
jgi:hypothetical protein